MTTTLLAIIDSRAVHRRWAGHWFAASLGFALVAANAHAQRNPEVAPVEAIIEIEQAPGSQVCPDKEAVFRSIQRLFPEREFRQGSSTSNSTARARVTIRPLPPGHEAVLTLLPPRHGERVIREEDQNCRGLADALALAFVMLVAPPSSSAESPPTDEAPAGDAPSVPPPSPAAPEPKPAEPEKVPIPTRVPETQRATRPFRVGFGASIVGGLGVLSEPALGAASEAELFHERGFGLSLQGLRLWALPAEAEGGSVTLTLWGALFGPCYRQRFAGTSRLDACLRFGLGSQHASVEGFQSSQPGNFPWQVLVPSLSYRHGMPGLGELLSGFVRIGFVTQLNPQSFSVRPEDGSGQNATVASGPRFGVMTDIGLVFGAGPF